MNYFETERLIFRDWKETDLDDFINLNSDEDVMRFYPKKLSKQESLEMMIKIKKEFEDYGYGFYALESKENNDFIGFLGFHKADFDADFTPCIEIGWKLKKEFWGRGLATEGARKCIEYGLDVLNFNKIYSFTSEVNIPSQNVMKKIGMKFDRHFEHPKVEDHSVLKKHVLYVIS